MPSKKKTLIIGDGLVGASAIFTLCQKGLKDIYVSSHKHGDLKKQLLFNQEIPTSFEDKGGLGRLWHSVCDLGLLNRLNFHSSSLTKKLIGDIKFDKDTEFVPFSPIRPVKILKKLNYNVSPATKLIEPFENNVRVTFCDGSIDFFDKVLVCHGALPEEDCLINSDLAEISDTVSDHLVAQVEGLKKSLFGEKKSESVVFSKKGFTRNYRLFNDSEFKFKISARPTYNENRKKAFHLDKGIYVGSTLDVFKRIISKASLNILKQSFFLRYGLFSRSENWKGFINIAVKNCYIRKNGSFVVDKAKISQLSAFLLKHDLLLDEDSLMSGIHFHNSYKSLSSLVSNNKIDDRNIILIGPAYNFDVGAEHFTFQMMLIAEKIARELYEK